MTKIMFCLLVTLAMLSLGRAQKTASCQSSDNNNPCSPLRVAGRYHYAYMHDTKKFVQCNAFGGCFVRPCAPGTYFSYDVSVCITGRPANIIIKEQFCSTKLYFAIIPTTTSYIGSGSSRRVRVQYSNCQQVGSYTGLSLNACQQKACEVGGNAINYYRQGSNAFTCDIRKCSGGDMKLTYKYFYTRDGGVTSNVYSSAFSCAAGNSPCTKDNIKAEKFYHENYDKKKFVQCDAHGQCFDMPCGAATAWSQAKYTCDHA